MIFVTLFFQIALTNFICPRLTFTAVNKLVNEWRGLIQL